VSVVLRLKMKAYESQLEVFDHLESGKMVDGKIEILFQCIRCNLCQYKWLDNHGNLEGSRLISVDKITQAISSHNRLYHP